MAEEDFDLADPNELGEHIDPIDNSTAIDIDYDSKAILLSQEMTEEIGDAEDLVHEWQTKYDLEVRREAVTAQEEAMMALEAAQNKLKDLKAKYMPIHQDREVFYEKHIENRGSGSAYEPRKPAPDPKPISELQEFLKPVPEAKTTKKGKAKGKRKNK